MMVAATEREGTQTGHCLHDRLLPLFYQYKISPMLKQRKEKTLKVVRKKVAIEKSFNAWMKKKK